MKSALYRILDANLDRAREGLRIIEEWYRFGLNSPQQVEELKHLRQELATWHTPEIRAARDTPGDPGTDLTHPQEGQRTSVQQVLQANLCRVEEALRVLEEYGKIYHPDLGAAAKQMRYRVYALESELLAHHRRQKLQQAHLYLVTSPSDRLFEAVEASLQGGLTLLQYRDKEADDRVRLSQAQQLRQLCDRYQALFIVNDRVDLALAVNADGVHVGQQDLPIEVVRQQLGPHRLIGCSTTNPEEMEYALQAGADYIGVGPVYETPTKPGKPAAGFDYIRHAIQHASVPWFAIGGIDPNNIGEVVSAGVERVAVVRAIVYAEQPTLVTHYLISQLVRAQTLHSCETHPHSNP